MQRHLVVVLGLLAVLAAALVWWNRDAAAPRGEGTSVPEQKAAEPAAAPLSADTGAAGATGSVDDASSRVALPSAPSDAASDPESRDGPPGPQVVVEVRGEDGAVQAGVPVGLRVDRERRSHLAVRQDTGEDGVARLALPPKVRQGTLVAMLAFPLRDGPQVEIDAAAPPREPVVLTMPATGRVEVLLDQVEPDAEVSVELRLAAEKGHGPAFVPEVGSSAAQGRVLFRHVGLGLRLEVEAQRSGQSNAVEVQTDGPLLAGETVLVRVSMQPADGKPVIVAHLQREDGEPHRRGVLDVRMEAKLSGSHSSSSFSITSDREGTVRLAVGDQVGALAQRTLHLATKSGDGVLIASLELPKDLKPGDNDVGIVTLAPPAFVCDGVVVDRAGAVVADARLQVRSKVARPQSASGFYWQYETDLDAQTDAEGKFVVRGVPDGENLGIEVTADGYLPLDPQPFVLGASGLRLVVESAATLEGSVALGEVIDRGDVVVDLVRGEETKRARLRRKDDKDVFRFTSLPPGEVSVRVRLVGQAPGASAMVDRVTLRAGETNRDPRLQEVDLTEGLSALEFRVVDTAGGPVADARVVVLHGPQQEMFEGYMMSRGKGRVLTHAASVDLMVFAEGYCRARVVGLVDGQTIPLPKALTIRLSLPSEVTPPADPYRLDATLQPVQKATGSDGRYFLYSGTSGTYSGTGGWPWGGSAAATCDARGRAVVEVPASGSYELLWRLFKREAGGGTKSGSVGAVQRIVLRDVPQQSITGSFTAQDLEKAMKEL